MTRPLDHQVIAITGASSGVGRALVRAFAARGASLGLIARTEAPLNAAVQEAERLGVEAIACPADVADAAAVESAAATVEARFGRIDTWVNCAMATVFAPVTDVTPDEFKRVTKVTYLGYVYGTQAALRRAARDSPASCSGNARSPGPQRICGV